MMTSYVTEEGRPLGHYSLFQQIMKICHGLFEPSEEVMKITTGEYYTATFYVKNTTNKKMVAQAVPSVAPSNAAAHLKEIRMFLLRTTRAYAR
jgi:cytochrome c oxidase assembly protein Cox11